MRWLDAGDAPTMLIMWQDSDCFEVLSVEEGPVSCKRALRALRLSGAERAGSVGLHPHAT